MASAAILAVVTFASNIFAVVTLSSPGVGTCKVSPRCLTNITSPDVTPASVSVVPLIEYAETACSTPWTLTSIEPVVAGAWLSVYVLPPELVKVSVGKCPVVGLFPT